MIPSDAADVIQTIKDILIQQFPGSVVGRLPNAGGAVLLEIVRPSNANPLVAISREYVANCIGDRKLPTHDEIECSLDQLTTARPGSVIMISADGNPEEIRLLDG